MEQEKRVGIRIESPNVTDFSLPFGVMVVVSLIVLVAEVTLLALHVFNVNIVI